MHPLRNIAAAALLSMGAMLSPGAAACMLLPGMASDKAHPLLFQDMTNRAKAGDAQAQFFLGFMYGNGNGVPQDLAQAFFWYGAAAEQGDRDAQYCLGQMHMAGLGTVLDVGTAAVWHRKAADQGHEAAQASLGVQYDQGLGLPKDTRRALDWYQRSAQQGHGPAQLLLGLRQAMGQGMAKNEAQAYFWFLLAVASGEAQAIRARDLLAPRLTVEQRAKAERDALHWAPRKERSR